ncbi:MAG: rRNA maturation RNase YbeY [Lachnospiraceae bacterium]|nr:rRNA maturation RNase YbeY [Lachnospiraceae bacterium]
MTIYFEDEYSMDQRINFDCKEVAGSVIDKTLRKEGFPFDVQVSLTLTDEETIRNTNSEFRGIDSVTDVLSFPSNEFLPGEYDVPEDELETDPDTEEVVLGDIIICVERMLSQAEEYGHSVKREFAFLVTHSMLHLLGYDHMTDDERLVMEDKQRKILEELGITRLEEEN